MRVLITGGAGFIGAHLAEAYLGRGDEVTILDNLSTGRIENIQHLQKHPRFQCVIDSIHNQAVVAELMVRCDAMVHLSWDVPDSSSVPGCSCRRGHGNLAPHRE